MTRSDVVVYGATPGGIAAASVAGNGGANVVLLAPGRSIGGMLSNGICTAETENMDAGPEALAGAATAFTTHIGAYYGIDRPLYYWEPHAAEYVMRQMLDEAGVYVETDAMLSAVALHSGRVHSATLADGRIFEAALWIDCSYEGDLMAAVGISWTAGRESTAQYGEPLAGIRFIDSPHEAAPNTTSRRVYIDEVHRIDPYWSDGTLLDGIADGAGLTRGDASPLTMNYNFRPTLSTAPDRVPFPEPAGYRPERFELLRRWLRENPEAGMRDVLDLYPHPSTAWSPRPADWRWQVAPGTKWELNNKQAAVISIGHFGGQRGWPAADPAARKDIFADHINYTQGLLHFLGSDPDTPSAIRRELAGFGLAADEFTDNGHWPRELYVREARRMVGEYVLTEHDLLHSIRKRDAILRGTHKIDSHHVQRVTVPDGFRNEGRIWVALRNPYDIPLGAILPRRSECENVVVPVALSASHVAFCSIRLEMVWMSLAHAAGRAALLSLQDGRGVHEISISRLQVRLREDGFAL